MKEAGRLVLDPAHPGQYSLDRLYGVDPWQDPLVTTTTPPEASPYNIQKLRELEVDRSGRWLYVVSSQGLNGNEWLLVYDTAAGTETRIRLTDLSASLKSPAAMLVSAREDKLYLSSSAGTAARLFRLNLEGPALTLEEGELLMGDTRQVTSLCEDPADGRLYAVGFQGPDIPADLSRTHPLYAQYFSNASPVFTEPRVVRIQPAAVWTESAMQPVGLTSAELLALPLSAVLVPGGTVAADLNGDGRVDGQDYQIFDRCATGPAIPYAAGHLPAGCTLAVDDAGRIAADFDADGDVDQADFGVFQRCFSGADTEADPSCAD